MTTAIADQYADIARRLKEIEGKPDGVLIVSGRELALIREKECADMAPPRVLGIGAPPLQEMYLGKKKR
jgi:hypothetical protein